MAKDRKVFNPDGEELTLHDHNWVMDGVTLHPMPDVKRPVAGATVLWRCTKRNCQGLRESKYQFRRPRVNQNPNQFNAKIRALFQIDE